MSGCNLLDFGKPARQNGKQLPCECLMAENNRLRELVEDMLDCIDIQIAFERVPARWMQDEFTGRAREFGIEVDG